jgi:hypothetical protein
MAAADHRVNGNAFADAGRINTFTHGINAAKEFMADDARIAGKRVVAVPDMHIGSADAGVLNFHSNFARGRSQFRTILYL